MRFKNARKRLGRWWLGAKYWLRSIWQLRHGRFVLYYKLDIGDIQARIEYLQRLLTTIERHRKRESVKRKA